MAGPCRCHSARPEAERMQTHLIRQLNLFSERHEGACLCHPLCMCVCVHASRSGGVFLRQGCLAPRRAVPQKSEVWPYPSCNWIDWIQIRNMSWKFLYFLTCFLLFLASISVTSRSSLSSLSHLHLSFFSPFSVYYTTSALLNVT